MSDWTGSHDLGGGLQVRGGRGGIRVGLEAVLTAAGRLGTIGSAVARESAAAAAATQGALASPAVAAAALDPLRGVVLRIAVARAERAVSGATGLRGATGVVLGLGTLSRGLRGAVRAYAEGERVVGGMVSGVADGVGLTAGVLAGGTLVVGGIVGGAQGGEALYDHPWLASLFTEGASGFATGLLAPAAVTPLGIWALAFACAREGVHFPPRTDAEGVAVLAAVGSILGLLDEPVRAPTVRRVTTAPGAAPPVGLAGLARGDAQLNDLDRRVRVIELPQRDGSSRWIVQIPGTQTWDPRAGRNTFDVTSDVGAMAGRSMAATVGVAQALTMAQSQSRGPDGQPRDCSRDPVLLSGHSQGGIHAASLASDPGFRARHRVAEVVTFGAPISTFPVPGTIGVMSVEHRQDIVPRLDGTARRDGGSWTTVTRDLRGSGTPHTITAAHDATAYVRTAEAVDSARGSTSLQAWRERTDPFLRRPPGSPEPVVRDYTVSR